MKQGFKINRKVVNSNYDQDRIQELVSYAQSLNKRIVEYDKKVNKSHKSSVVK